MIQEATPRDFQLPDFLTRAEEKAIIDGCKNATEKFRILYYADTGARVTEGLNSKIGYMDMINRKVLIPTLKKRGDQAEFRKVQMSNRLFEAYISYHAQLPIEAKSKDGWLFPNLKDPQKPIRRQSIDKMIKKIGRKAGTPEGKRHCHILRHSFGTRLAAAGTPMHAIQYMMGHEKIETTSIYTHITPDVLKEAIKKIDDSPWHIKLKRRLFPIKKKVAALPVSEGKSKFIVGRKSELAQLSDLATKKRNILITGEAGIGKSLLLDNFYTGKILRLQDLRGGNRKTLGNILLWLYEGDKEEILKVIYPEDNYNFNKVVDRTKEKELMKLVKQVTQEKEYTLVIDSLDMINKTSGLLLEKLKEHFHIIAGARKIKVDYLHTFSNFTKIELPTLTRSETHLMIEKLTTQYRRHIPDFELLVNQVFRQTGGNPQYIEEIIEAYRAEGDFSQQTLHQIHHTAAQKPIDLTIVFVLALSSLMVIRYLGTEVGDDTGAFRFIGGAFLVFALFSRMFMSLGKRKYV